MLYLKKKIVDIIDSTIDNFIGFLNVSFCFIYYKSIYEKRIDDAIKILRNRCT